MELLKESVVGDYQFSTDRGKLDIDFIHDFVSKRSYWAIGIPRETLVVAIANSLCFGVYDQQKQIAFARLVTDYATFGYLADVFVVENFRGKGISKLLMKFIFDLDELKKLRRMILVTRDAHSLYQPLGFNALAFPDRYLELHRPDVYKENK